MNAVFETFDRVRDFVAFVRKRKDEKREHQFLDNMRRQKLETGTSGYRVVIDSDEDRLCSRLEEKGRLVRHGVDVYLLSVQGLSSRFRSRF